MAMEMRAFDGSSAPTFQKAAAGATSALERNKAFAGSKSCTRSGRRVILRAAVLAVRGKNRDERAGRQDLWLEKDETPSLHDASSFRLMPSHENNGAISPSPSRFRHGLPNGTEIQNADKSSVRVTPPSNPRSRPLKVAVDVDEVLGSFLSTLNTFVSECYSQQYKISEYYVYDFMKIWGCSQAEANERVHAFFNSDHFNDGICPIPGAYQSLCHLADFCDLVVVTSRQHVIQQPTLEWIGKHYPRLFKEVHFGNHFALEGKSRPKSEICRSIGAEVLIDDNPRYAIECAEHGIEVFLFDWDNSYPWSKTSDGPIHPLITRVHNWLDLEHTIFARFHS